MYLPHISVCICTYKRERLLRLLMDNLREQETGGNFTYSVVVADNDRAESARKVVADFSKGSSVPVTYCVEPQQNIALTRNRALEHVTGEYVAFIDDDEFPGKDWLLTLFNALHKYKADGALGPVKPHYETPPPDWVLRGKFHERPCYPTGFQIDWHKGRTGNVLLKRSIFPPGPAFEPKFLTGEDQDFFRRMIANGHVFVWCNDAVAYEVVPPIRWNRRFMLQRALLRGKVSVRHPTFSSVDVCKSLMAAPAYLLSLPLLFCLGHHLFMKYLISFCDHSGRILALVGIDPVREKYITE